MANRRALSVLVITFGLPVHAAMLPLKSRETEDFNLASHSPTVQAELTALAHLAFSFEMDGHHKAPDNHSRHTHGSRSRSTSRTRTTNANTRHDQQDATELAQLVAATGISPQHMFPSHSYSSTMSPVGDSLAGHLNFHDAGFASGEMSHMRLPELSSADFSWLQLALDQQHSQASTSSAGAASSTTSADFDNQTEADGGISIDEEKRRRNTAASARFRIKKKQKTVNLERSISDLTGRAEDLEREAADLRQENGWLKEIVMLKSARFPPMNHMFESGQRSDAGPSRDRLGSRQNQSVSDKGSSPEEQSKDGNGRKGKTKKANK